MTQSTERLTRLQSGMGNLAKAVLPRAARWCCGWAFFAMGLVSQAQDTPLPNTTVTSGSSAYTATGFLTAGTSGTYPGAVFVVNNSQSDSADVTFTAGIIQLEPGFHAIAGTATNTFHAIVAPPLPQTGTFAQASGISTFTASSPIGYQNIDQVHAMFNWAVDGIDSCYVMYSRVANAAYLMNDTGTQWLGGQAPGTAGATVQNSQCQLNIAATTVAASGNTLTVGFAIAFFPAFVGPQRVFEWVNDVNSQNSGWQQVGNWQSYPASSQAPTMSVNPASGSGLTGTFTFHVNDANGYKYIAEYLMVIGEPGVASCEFLYYRGWNAIQVLSDDSTAWNYWATPGVAGTVGNSQCTLNPGQSSVSASGNDLNVTVSITFNQAYVAGSSGKRIQAYVYDHALSGFGWTPVGTWAGAQTPDLTMDGHRRGIRSTGSYWGASPEQIDLLSGNLNYSVPLIQARGRSGWGATFALSYNSQIWRQSGGTATLLGRDTGFGLGWTLQAGSLLPVLNSYYILTDSTGAQYKLDQNNNGLWTSRDGTYATYNSSNQRLYFPDGSFWAMTVTAAAGEQDAGTLYPSSMQDTNGNQIQIQYGPAAGTNAPNTSGRITYIIDTRAIGSNASYSLTYAYLNGGDLFPHLTGITNGIGSSENYAFSYGNNLSLSSPFTMTAFGAATVLQTVTVNNLNISYNLQYGLGTGELTQSTMPTGGSLAWGYRTYTYAGSGLSYREVQTRQMSPSAGTTYSWNFTLDNNVTLHTSAVVSDLGAGTSKVWTFETAAGPTLGLSTSYEERNAAGTALLRKSYLWAQDTPNVYIGTVTSTLDPGTTYAAQSKTVQVLDSYGNVTTSQVYDYGAGAPTRSYAYYYLHQANGNYLPRYICNRLQSATVTAGGVLTTLVTNTYDNWPLGLIARTGLRLHDDANYGVGFAYRGNLTLTSSMGDSREFGYETTGVVAKGYVNNHYFEMTLSNATSYALPGVITPQGNANLATSLTYAASFAVTSVTGPNGAQGTTTYDTSGRPQQTKIPDGAQTNYTYTYNPNTQRAALVPNPVTAPTVETQWKKTTQDGFGRATRVETGHDAVTVSQVDTQYAPCACSPLGKLWRVSQPYAPNGTPVWTTYTYDGSGRTLTVTAADGASVTSYNYQGNQTTVTDPAGKWKKFTTDAMGNLITVTEPDPASGPNLVTNYTYNVTNQLLQVGMPRNGPTQTRTFVWGGTNMVSTTNPENGTVTYTYDGAHHVTKRTDAKLQETSYTYDAYGRLTQVKHYAWVWVYVYGQPPYQQLQEQTAQEVNYAYDTNSLDGTFSQNTWGRLASVGFGHFNYQYSYSQAGRVTKQRLQYNDYNSMNFDASYAWDNVGRMTSQQYPNGLNLQYQFDAMGRLGGMTENSSPVASATYGVAGETLNLTYDGYSETRTYNSLFQLTRMTVGGVMDMQYVYPAGQNNGRITQAVDGISGETVVYTYDAVNRLASAAATNGTWGQAFAYDGFGNLTGKTVTQGSPPALSVSYDPLTNHQVGAGYDANGNIAGFQGSFPYDVENRMVVALDGSSYLYDPSGKRVMKIATNNTRTLYFYGITGQKLVTYTCIPDGSGNITSCGYPATNVYFGGKLMRSNGVTVATDRLGSVRGNSTGERMSYYPYGEERTSTADGREKFGTYTRDNPGQDYADQRYYAPGSGRFMTPDPSGLDATDVSNPDSWNMYAYVGGDPVNYSDPEGLLRCGDIPGANASGPTGRTFEDILDTGTDYGLLAVTIYVESSGKASSQGFAEMAAIGAVIMNRFNIVNGYTQMTRSNGTVQSAPLAWGKADTLASIIINPTQFEMWQGQGGTLTDSAQSRLDHALDSAANSAECYALQTAYYTALDDLAFRGKNILLTDAKTGLAFTGFNSFDYTQKYDWEQSIGQFGSANKFYGVPIPIPATRGRRPIPLLDVAGRWDSRWGVSDDDGTTVGPYCSLGIGLCGLRLRRCHRGSFAVVSPLDR